MLPVAWEGFYASVLEAEIQLFVTSELGRHPAEPARSTSSVLSLLPGSPPSGGRDAVHTGWPVRFLLRARSWGSGTASRASEFLSRWRDMQSSVGTGAPLP